jgi:hypothetical protein
VRRTSISAEDERDATSVLCCSLRCNVTLLEFRLKTMARGSGINLDWRGEFCGNMAPKVWVPSVDLRRAMYKLGKIGFGIMHWP